MERWRYHQTVKSLPRSGRPSKITEAEARYIRTFVKRNPWIKWAVLLGLYPQACQTTIRKSLGKPFYRKYRFVMKIMLTDDNAAERLTHARSFVDAAR